MIELVCRPHCRFFRPGEKEELSCRGYDFFGERVSDQEARLLLGPLGDCEPPSGFEHDARIENLLCSECPFRERDCDFMGGSPIADSAPCGGYVLLARLIASGSKEAEAWLEKA